MKTSDNHNLEQPTLDANIQPPTKLKTTILYSDLTDNSPITTSSPVTDNVATSSTTETYTIIAEQFADNQPSLKFDIPPTNLGTAKMGENVVTDTQVITTLHKQHKSESLTDDNILQRSHQLSMIADDQLEDDKTATGVAVEHMDVVLKQWYFTVQWQRTTMPKSGLYNKFKKRTQLMDLDLSCLLCNRYGEVIDKVWFKNVRDKAESVRHQGDELLGKKPLGSIEEVTDPNDSQHTSHTTEPKMNQESMVIHLDKLPPQVFHVVMVVSSYHGYPLAKAKDGLCQLSDDEGNLISDLAFAKLSSDTKALWFASLTRSADSWRYNTEHQPLANSDMALIEQEVSDKLVRTAR